FGGDIKGRTQKILELHKANLESMGSSLENVLKVTVFLADVKTEKNAMNEVYGRFFPKDPPARSAFGIQFPDTATRVEIELVAWIPRSYAEIGGLRHRGLHPALRGLACIPHHPASARPQLAAHADP